MKYMNDTAIYNEFMQQYSGARYCYIAGPGHSDRFGYAEFHYAYWPKQSKTTYYIR